MNPPPPVGRIVVAPDSFKGTFTAAEIAAAIAVRLRQAGYEVDVCPLADGGEGTMDVLLAARGGRRLPAVAHDPLGRTIEPEFALLDDGTAVVDVAAASGLPLVDPSERDPEIATTFGTGELIAAAIAAGARRILVAAGGSATVDGGTGAIAALHASGGLQGAAIDVLCDTRVPFERAASVFAPQKGADAAAVVRLDRDLDLLAARLPKDPRGVPMSGAAGGLAGGLWATFDARLGSGAELVIEEVGLWTRLEKSTCLLTGEGRLDSQSLDGKLIGALAALCRSLSKPLLIVAGQIDLAEADLGASGIAAAMEGSTLDEIATAALRLAAAWSPPPQDPD